MDSGCIHLSFAEAQAPPYPNDLTGVTVNPNTTSNLLASLSEQQLTSVVNEQTWTREYDAEWQVQELERRSRHCLERCLKVLLGMDLFVFGVAWVLYAGLLFWYNNMYNNKNTNTNSHKTATTDPSARIFLAVAILMAVLLWFRSITGLCALRFISARRQQRCCWRGVVVPISIGLMLLYFVVTVLFLIVSWMEPHAMEHFISRHVPPDDTSSSAWLCPAVVARWILQREQYHATATVHYVGIFGLLLTIVEGMKWQLVSYYYYRHCKRVGSNASTSSLSASPPPVRSVIYNNEHTIANASWWSGTMSAIGEEDDHDDSPAVWREPLLPDGQSHRRRRRRPRRQRRSWWHNIFSRRPQHDGEEDHSVALSSSSSSETDLFASVQEEWATRSQERGPLWWASHEEEKNHQNQNPSETDPEEPSWLQNTESDP